MSRIGKMPLVIPSAVKYTYENNVITFTGNKGSLHLTIPEGFSLDIKNNNIFVINNSDNNAMWGTLRNLLRNITIGVDQGFTKELLLVGVGYKSKVEGGILELTVGFSHTVKYKIPSNVNITVNKNTEIIISGIDKQVVGQVAAKIRDVKKPERYKGTGIRYRDEVIILKQKKGK